MTGRERRIVAGVDGSESSKAALSWAIRQARLTGASVDAVTAWRYPPGYGMAELGEDAVDFEGEAEKTLSRVLAEVAWREPTVTIRSHVAEGAAATVLLRAASGADLLVVGSRGRGELASAALGSVSLHCVLHAHCPVLVLRDGREEAPAPGSGAADGRVGTDRPATKVPRGDDARP